MAHELKPRLKGVIFLGTPHRGTSFSRYGLLTSYALAPLGSDVGIMRILGLDSIELDDLQKDFDNNFKAVTRKYFFEKDKTIHQLWGFATWMREFVGRRLDTFLVRKLTWTRRSRNHQPPGAPMNATLSGSTPITGA
jgi:hypothetical protein